MAIDVFSGSLTRYYAGAWENEAARYARENNLTYKVIQPLGKKSCEDTLNHAEINEVIQNWLAILFNSLNITCKLRDIFQEEYFTKRIKNFNLLYTASCYTYLLEENLNGLLSDNRATRIQKLAENTSDFIYFKDVESWFPIDLPGSGIFKVNFPNQQEKVISGTMRLIEELNHISQRVYKLPVEELCLLTRDDFHPLKSDICTMYEAAIFSLKNYVPIILDY